MTAPETMRHLGECAYTAFPKELYLSVHPVGGLLTGKEMDALALGLARVAPDFQPAGGAV